jgi:DNA-binding transcriptional LysR family regulator
MPELRHLKLFVAVAEELSFTAAARREFVSQQALSRTIQQLETELEVALFRRTTRSVRLTPAGEAMLPAARRSAAAVEDAVRAARSTAAGTSTTVRADLGSGALLVQSLVARRIRLDQPSLALHLSAEGEARASGALLEGRLDVLLGLSTSAAVEVERVLLRREPLRVAMREGHSLASKSSVSLDDLALHDLLLPADAAGAEWNRFIALAWSEAGAPIRRSLRTVHGPIITAQLLRDSDDVLPTLEWADEPDGLVFLPLVEPEVLFPWFLMISPAATGRAEIEALRESALAATEEIATARRLTVAGG